MTNKISFCSYFLTPMVYLFSVLKNFVYSFMRVCSHVGMAGILIMPLHMIHFYTKITPFEGGHNSPVSLFKQKSNIKLMHGYIVKMSRYKIEKDPGFILILRLAFHFIMIPRYFWHSITINAM